jgi:MFS family permease
LCWSTTIIMKIDLVGPARRGLAMGLNEFAGYMAVALAALATGYLAATYGLRPQPFYLGLGIALAGLLLSLVFVRETRPYAELEAKLHHPARSEPPPGLRTVFWRVSFGDRTLFSINQAGLVNNLNDGLAWGLLPLYFAAAGLGVEQIGLLAATYPGVWGIGQLATGALSDVWGRRGLIAGGMLLQGGALALLLAPVGFLGWLGGAIFLGVGTAMVYPTLLAAIGDIAHPSWRAAAVGVYRLWRDSGYAFGALLAGLVADRLGLGPAIGVVAGLTFLSGVVVFMAMRETRTRP